MSIYIPDQEQGKIQEGSQMQGHLDGFKNQGLSEGSQFQGLIENDEFRATCFSFSGNIFVKSSFDDIFFGQKFVILILFIQ